jgi:mannose-6-phosphate isomerase-like protein (cupin superfamily)
MPFVDLSTFPATPTAFGRWQPLNAPLGLGGFGINAIECDPGEVIDTTHDETDTGQHEAYIVVAGRAEFHVGTDVFDVGPGTVVAAPDPASTRSFRPLEPGTRIICIGAAPTEGDPAFGEWIG